MAQVAVAMHLEPAQVWAMDPQDLATVVAVLEDRNKRRW